MHNVLYRDLLVEPPRMSLGHVYVRVDVGVGRKRGVLRTSNRERVTKSYDEHQASYEKALPNSFYSVE